MLAEIRLVYMLNTCMG